MAAVMAPMLSPKERIICAGPVPALAERMGVPWHNVNVLNRPATNAFFSSLEKSDASFFLVVDEADSFMGAAGFYSRPLQELIRNGRNYGQGIMLLAHSIGETNKSFINNATLVLFARQSTPGSREWLRKYAKDECPDIDEIVASLEKHQFLFYGPEQTPKVMGIGMADPEEGTIKIVPLETARKPKEDDDSKGQPESAEAPGPSPANPV